MVSIFGHVGIGLKEIKNRDPCHSLFLFHDHHDHTLELMNLSTSSPPPPDSESGLIIKKFVWHCSDIAHIESKIVELCKGDFGIPKHYYSTPVKDLAGVPISNSLFLPPPGAPLEKYYWDITGESGPPPLPDHRELWVHVMGIGVDGLSGARTPLGLSLAIGHAMLGTRFCISNFLAQSDSCR